MITILKGNTTFVSAKIFIDFIRKNVKTLRIFTWIDKLYTSKGIYVLYHWKRKRLDMFKISAEYHHIIIIF